MSRVTVSFCVLLSLSLFQGSVFSEDWPTWRNNSGRTAVSVQGLEGELHLQWSRELPEINPAFDNPRLQFDGRYEPVIKKDTIVLASSVEDTVTAYDLKTGQEKWSFFTNGPNRLAPVLWGDRVLFGSDDGYFYCLSLQTGELQWKKQVALSDRKLLANERLTSVWPVRGGAVVDDGTVYLAAGVWPFEGIVATALSVETGEVIWQNDRLGYLYGDHPHQTVAMGGLAPQGYLLINDDELVIPCSAAYPARLNKETGELIEFALPKVSRYPGGWFSSLDPESAKAVRRGTVSFDEVINQQRHEDKQQFGTGDGNLHRQITAAEEVISFDKPDHGIAGPVQNLVPVNDYAVVVTEGGQLCVYGTENRKPVQFPLAIAKANSTSIVKSDDEHPLDAETRRVIESLHTSSGYALSVGSPDAASLDMLLEKTDLKLIVLENDTNQATKLRQHLQAAGHYGSRGVVWLLETGKAGLPPYWAELVYARSQSDLERVLGANGELNLDSFVNSVRPYGGQLHFAEGIKEDTFRSTLMQTLYSEWGDEALASKANSTATFSRVGPLPGSQDYQTDWELNQDELVRFPVGVLWFNDLVKNFKRSPQPSFEKGVMVSRGKSWLSERDRSDYTVDFPLFPPSFSDVYTGRLFEESEAQEARAKHTVNKEEASEPTQYRPPYQKDAWHPAKPEQGTRINPLSGKEEKRDFPKNYGCDGGVDYGFLFTMRSGTPAFYDKTLESGTMFLSGPRSGCTNSIIPANGLLNVPYFYEGCTCSYPLPTSMALYAVPETHEQWAVWGESEPESIQRIGINFGAPGARMTREGTLWLNFPSLGEPSPKLTANTSPATVDYSYRHSLRIDSSEKWPWVDGSAAIGLSEFKLEKLKPGTYTVRLYFCDLPIRESGARVQTISVQGEPVLNSFDIVAEAAGDNRGIVKSFDGITVGEDFLLELVSEQGETMINGLELIRTGD
ncbi:outer membrane biogenesis protein BamB [Polystyrenella longa]|uniref:Outer membrane biogenesis protein BamB n=1 Tax=Polystyrenella longa TaxID=2528007 RepID=A0A518CQV2_9PLAN|nr:PQQ-binding-like beta-propeller repeat protein [Polystyrenella longa]QDU81603.1 outer membrane biogenesis protein BamB [Polystyrenella longa]